MKRALNVLLLLLTVAYPLLVYAGVSSLAPHWFALALAGLAVARAALARQWIWWGMAAGALVLGGLTWYLQGLTPVKLYPVMVSAAMLVVFGLSLLRPPTVIERLARLAEPNLPAQAVPYTRRVTQVWCVYFLLNGLVALATALWASTEVWALYNGLISYGVMGGLFAGEWLVRRRVRARIDQADPRGAQHG